MGRRHKKGRHNMWLTACVGPLTQWGEKISLAPEKARVRAHSKGSPESPQWLTRQQRRHGAAEGIRNRPQQFPFLDGHFLAGKNACGAGLQHLTLLSRRGFRQDIKGVIHSRQSTLVTG